MQVVVRGLDSPAGIGLVLAPAAGSEDKIYGVSAAPPDNVPALSPREALTLALLLLAVTSFFLRRSAAR